MEILTDLDHAVWPPSDAQCKPTSPCEGLKRRRSTKHDERLEYADATLSAEYPDQLCTLLAEAIFKHHGILF
ncbi:MAG: hypothetical protein OSB10_11195 [Planctomycetota bacterium]|nr:hypothetical protein [Planctomycetota bacterium]